MPKIKSNRRRTAKSEPFESMKVDETTDKVEDPASLVEEETESNRSVYKRHSAEWKRMKGSVAQLKLRRKSLTKKQRDLKKQLSQEIKILISSMTEKHQNELRELGIISPKRSDMMEDDGDDE